MQLVKEFAADEPTSLFGTLSLWQGVDVPGPSLRLVVIDRIPFPRPSLPPFWQTTDPEVVRGALRRLGGS
jgi:Rad3-related DNA helicase